MAEVESDITKKLGEKRKSQMKQVQFIIHGMERELENLDELYKEESWRIIHSKKCGKI